MFFDLLRREFLREIRVGCHTELFPYGKCERSVEAIERAWSTPNFGKVEGRA
jgi:hypothetical protein